MYTYYALQTIGIRAPKVVSMGITSLQIAQMVGGIAVLVIAQYNVMSGRSCNAPLNVLVSGLLMYGSYFALFVQFFVRAYLSSQRSRQQNSSSSSSIRGKGGEVTGVDACNNTFTKESSQELMPQPDGNSNHIKAH